LKFYSLKNLYTKTNNNVLLNIPETDLVDIPKEKFILFLDNINAPSYNDDKVREMITKKINLIKCDTLIHKSHLNLSGKNIKKINTSKKVIYADPRIPAEFYIPHNQNIYVIGSETSVLIYAKIINKNNKVICFDNLFKVDENYRKLYLDYSVEIIDVN